MASVSRLSETGREKCSIVGRPSRGWRVGLTPPHLHRLVGRCPGAPVVRNPSEGFTIVRDPGQQSRGDHKRSIQLAPVGRQRNKEVREEGGQRPCNAATACRACSH